MGVFTHRNTPLNSSLLSLPLTSSLLSLPLTSSLLTLSLCPRSLQAEEPDLAEAELDLLPDPPSGRSS